MKRHGEWVDMVRLVASLFGLLVLALPALAGDRAAIDVIGFSEDARYLAFEEFGVQDGSGLHYSSIYLIDLSTDSWVVGTPFRVEAEAETMPLAAVRAQVRAEADEALSTLGIAFAADLVALVGDGAPGTDGLSLHFGVPGHEPGMVLGDYQLRLSRFTTRAAAPCKEWFSVEPQGYELEIADGSSARLIHRDEALPRSRGCPTDYRIYGVVMPYMSSSISDAVALISVYPGGFEGPSRRFLAVPLGL